MNRLKNIFVTLGFLVIVPILGTVTSLAVGYEYNNLFTEALTENTPLSSTEIKELGVNLSNYCQKEDASKEICEFQKEIDLLFQISVITAINGIGLIFLIFLGKLVAGKNRTVLANIINPITVLIISGLSISLLIQTGIFTYSIYLLESTYLGRVHFVALAVIGIGSIGAAIVLLDTAFKKTKNSAILIFGERLNHENAPQLVLLIEEISKKISSETPTNIIVGLEPNFYVTASKIKLASEEKELNGTTLYISLPYLSIMTKKEISAIIGHELGHFKGQDTVYSLKFYPAYSRLHKAVDDLADGGFMVTPVISTLSLIRNEFSYAERKIGRSREIEADKVGASLYGPIPLITALLKFSYFSQEWDALRKFNIEKLNEGVVLNDLSAAIIEFAKFQFESLQFENVYANLLGIHTSHPTDTHPSIKQRMAALQVPEGDITKDMLLPAEISPNEYLGDTEKICEDLTYQEHKLMIELGLATIPETKN